MVEDVFEDQGYYSCVYNGAYFVKQLEFKVDDVEDVEGERIR